MDLKMGIEAFALICRSRGASLYDIADELGITVRYARDVVDELTGLFPIYADRDGRDFAHPKRVTFHLLEGTTYEREIVKLGAKTITQCKRISA